MGRDCASERVPIALAEADQRTPGLPRPAHGPETTDHSVVQPDVAQAALVGFGLVTHAAERERSGNRLERLSGDGDLDHGDWTRNNPTCPRAGLNGSGRGSANTSA